MVQDALARRESLAAHHGRYYTEDRERVFAHYGRECACCGSMELLEMDHVDGNGQLHRDVIPGNGSGSHLYRWLIRNDFPSGFQVLCRPCNRHKGSEGRCWLDHSAGAPSYEAQARVRVSEYRRQYHSRGDRVRYRSLHRRVRDVRGRAGDYPCAHADGSCHGQMQWANVSGEYRDVNDFMPLCRYHHRRYDRRTTVEDLSSLAKDSMWITSQAAGNMMSSNEKAMAAPGSRPVDPLPDRDNQVDPTVDVPKQTQPGDDGKTQAKGEDWSPPGPPKWGFAPAHSN